MIYKHKSLAEKIQGVITTYFYTVITYINELFMIIAQLICRLNIQPLSVPKSSFQCWISKYEQAEYNI
jgi:hypothetical protein